MPPEPLSPLQDKHQPKRPEWAPPDLDESKHHGFASEVKAGSGGAVYGKPPPKRRKLSHDDYVRGVRAGDRGVLARAITLVESNAPAHQAAAQELLQDLLPDTGKAIRVGISGMPGAGKSTFIETLGLRLCDSGHRVAVLAVDPSSSIGGGSILGDKVRMEKLSRRTEAFIRPSPSSGTLGGVARKSRESMLLCEAAGYDVLLVETVGVGQNEVTVRSMVDFFLLLTIAGAGDEIQGIKKGIMEIADAIVVNKADGDNLRRAKHAGGELSRVLHYLQPATPGWRTRAHLCSAQEGTGIAEVWEEIESFRAATGESGVLETRRREQQVRWMHALIDEAIRQRFHQRTQVKDALKELEGQVMSGEVPVVKAVEKLLEAAGE